METAIGTYPYMAPEVFNEHYTISSDVFSMGLVMSASFHIILGGLVQNCCPLYNIKDMKIVLATFCIVFMGRLGFSIRAQHH
jgi:serine/threonine protein kinase